MAWRPHMFAPAQPSQQREPFAMAGHEAVATFGCPGERRRMEIPIEKPLLMWIFSQGPKCGLRAAVNRAIGVDQMHGAFEAVVWHLGKLRRHCSILKRGILNAITRDLLPSPYPDCA